MNSWVEFVAGEEDSVDLKDTLTQEEESVRFVEASEGEIPHILIRSNKYGPLFERVVGCTAYALSAHSDNLMLKRMPD